MYVYDPERISYFATTDYRGKHTPFGIKAKDRLRHMYVIGKTGMGKSTLLENLAIQDIQSGEGLCFIDPHGSTAEKLLDYVPKERIKDVIYFAPFDMEYPIGFNIMEDVGYDKRHLVVAGLMSAFKRIWVDAWSARMEYILQNTLFALLEYPESTLIDVNRMYVDKTFRKKVIENITDPIVKSYWVEEFTKYTDRYTQEATPAIQNKIGQFTSNPLIRNIIGQPNSTINIRQIMDERKVLIVNLAKGRIGEQNADMLGSILTTKIYLEAMGRAELPAGEQAKLPPFYLYVDEFQSVVNDSFANILSEARKYKLALTIAHQYLEQVDENIRAAVFGNAGTIITFRVGPFDAEILKTIFEPTFTVEDIVNLGFAQIYLSLMVDGVATQPFSARTLPPLDPPPVSYAKEVIKHSQLTYGRPREEVEELIKIRTREKKIEQKLKAQNQSQNSNQQGTKEKNSSSKSKSANPNNDSSSKPKQDSKQASSKNTNTAQNQPQTQPKKAQSANKQDTNSQTASVTKKPNNTQNPDKHSSSQKLGDKNKSEFASAKQFVNTSVDLKKASSQDANNPEQLKSKLKQIISQKQNEPAKQKSASSNSELKQLLAQIAPSDDNPEKPSPSPDNKSSNNKPKQTSNSKNTNQPDDLKNLLKQLSGSPELESANTVNSSIQTRPKPAKKPDNKSENPQEISDLVLRQILRDD